MQNWKFDEYAISIRRSKNCARFADGDHGNLCGVYQDSLSKALREPIDFDETSSIM